MEYVGQGSRLREEDRDEYNEKDYHQPSDEIRTDWDYTGAVEDMRMLAELGWRVATRPLMPSYNQSEQFARPRATATR